MILFIIKSNFKISKIEFIQSLIYIKYIGNYNNVIIITYELL